MTLRFLFACAALVAIWLGVADTLARGDTKESIERAISIRDSAKFEETLAEVDEANSRAALRRAVRINPRSSGAWIELGMIEESSGELDSAAKSFLTAAQVDRQYLPAWTLANFYYRRENLGLFWMWARRAAALTYDDFRPLLRLCDDKEQDPEILLAQLGGARQLRAAYLNFLIGENRLAAAQLVARKLKDERANDPHLIDLADRQLRVKNVEAALELWNIASGFSPIDPSTDRILTNGDLARAPMNLGFDWRLSQTQGVLENWKPTELLFTFSGSQPENCVLLEQAIPLGARQYRLRFDYLTGEPAPSGIHWSLNEIAGPPIGPSPHWSEGTFAFRTTGGLAQLRLLYRRERGTTRTEGKIEIRNLRLEVSS